MMKKFTATVSLLLLLMLFVFLVFINNQLLSTYRVDLTENRVYSLSEGTYTVLSQVDEPVSLYFFFSDSTTKGMTQLRNYASRVESLLREYAQASGGKVTLHVIDPVPFSEDEDRANQFGLTGAALGNVGEPVYFGLAGTNLLDDHFSIPFFDPQQEQFLEYDISKLIYQLSEPDEVNLTVVTDIPLTGEANPMVGGYVEPYVFYQQLSQLYDITVVNSQAPGLPEDTDVLMLLHPQELAEGLLYDIDQFAMKNGRILAFVDPHFESDPIGAMSGGRANSSTLPLLSAWGVNVDLSNVVLDAQLAMDMQSRDGDIIKHFGILGLTAGQLDRQDIVTAGLDSINGASFGVIQSARAPLKMETLLSSSVNAGLTNASDYADTTDPALLQRGFGGNTEPYVLGARFTGTAHAYFKQSPGPERSYVPSTNSLNLIVVSDADLLSNRFWVQQSRFFGEAVYSPFANNGDIVINAIDNLSGSNALISIRSRGAFTRPFTMVEALETRAEARYRQQEEKLQNELINIEKQLTALQEQQGQGGNLALNEAQQALLNKFTSRRVEIRQALREVRYQLDRDINSLGNKLKVLNIVVAPLAMLTLLYFLAFVFKRRPGKRYKEKGAL